MSGEQDSDLMERPSLPSSGLAGMSSYGTQSPASSTPSRMSFKEKFRRDAAAREAKAMEGLSRGSDWDTPPAVENPKREPEPVIDSRSLPLRGGEALESEKVHKLNTAPLIGDGGSDTDGSFEDEDSNQDSNVNNGSLPILSLGRNEHIVLVPVVPSVRDVYNLQMKKNSQTINDFIANYEQASSQTLSKVDKFITDLKLIGDHQDLVAGATDSQQSMSVDTAFKWAINCSPKCLFLERLFNSLRSHNISIAVLARPGMTLDILTSLLDARKISYLRPDTEKNVYYDSELRVTLLPTGFADGQYVVSPVDAVIAFDYTFFTGEHYTTILRAHPYDPNLIAPLIHLVTDQSAEHVELCLSKNMDPAERKAYLCAFTMQQKEVGMYTKPRPEEAAPTVADFLLRCKESEGNDAPEWPLSQDLEVSRLIIPAGFRQEQSGASTQPFSLPSASLKNSQRATNKRTRDVAGEESTKRMRMTPVEDAPSSEEVSRVPDSASVGGSATTHSQYDPSLHWTFAQVIADRADREAKYAEEKKGFFATVRIPAPLRWLAELTKKKIADLQAQLRTRDKSAMRVSEVEAEVRDKDQLNRTLQDIIEGLETRLAEHVDLVKKFEPKYLALTLERNQAANALRESEDRAAALAKRLEARTTELNIAQQKVVNMKDELKAVRNQLILSSVPEVCELEELRQKLQAAEEEKEKAEKHHNRLQSDLDFTRDQYQQASQHVGAFREEVAALKEDNEKLQRKADENKVKIQKIQAENTHSQLVDRIDELKEEVEDLKAQLLRKAEELKKRSDRSLRGVGGAQSPMITTFGGYGRTGGSI